MSDNAGKGLLLGMDFGGTKCAVVLGNNRGDVVDRDEWPSRSERGPVAMCADMMTRAGRFSGFDRIGVSVGGPLNSREGIVYSPPNLPGWDAWPLRAMLEEEFACPVNVEHDAAACAFAEYLWGAGQGCENLAYLTCGTGFGSGFVFGGKIHRGAGGGSCEVGHVSLRTGGPVAFGKMGSAESYCSGAALALLAAWRFPERWGANPPEGRELSRLAGEGDAGAGEILRLNAEAVGQVSAMLADILGLDCILLGSLARYLGEPWLHIVRRSFLAHVLPSTGEKCRIAASGLGVRLQDCSTLAAAMVVQEP